MTWRPFGKKNAENPADDAVRSTENPDIEKSNAAESEIAESSESGFTPKKNAPTPKRSVAEAQNIHPLVPDRATSKANYKKAKVRQRERQNEEYTAMQTGDISHMPRAERLASRVYMRDYIDARFNLGEVFIPVVIILFVGSFVLAMVSGLASTVAIMLVYIYLLASVVDTGVMWHKLKKLVASKYGDKAVGKGSRSAYYAWSRAIQMRRWRMPKPREKKRGHWPK